jgi:5-methylcytosine-specific restriction endonuclease McrA
MPIDKTSMDMLSPIFDFTSSCDKSFMESFNSIEDSNLMGSTGLCNADRRIVSSGKTGTKRSVSETKKKYVASQQDWKCGSCEAQLDHTFEIDHRVRLEYGGGNDVQNLVALCRNCHGKKTASENM